MSSVGLLALLEKEGLGGLFAGLNSNLLGIAVSPDSALLRRKADLVVSMQCRLHECTRKCATILKQRMKITNATFYWSFEEARSFVMRLKNVKTLTVWQSIAASTIAGV